MVVFAFEGRLLSIKQRKNIAAIIVIKAERIVYEYSACDREYFWPQIGKESPPEFRNRSTGMKYCLEHAMLSHFCELTVANEIEISIDNPDFLNKYGKDLCQALTRMQPFLSKQAVLAVETHFLQYA